MTSGSFSEGPFSVEANAWHGKGAFLDFPNLVNCNITYLYLYISSSLHSEANHSLFLRASCIFVIYLCLQLFENI
jgi:hypothetical protein